MPSQLPLAISAREHSRFDNFIPGTNLEVLNALRALATPGGFQLLVLSGAKGSGKTHLLSATAYHAQEHGASFGFLPGSELDQLSPNMLSGMEQLDLVLFDDVDRVAGLPEWEAALFTLFNQCKDMGRTMVFTATQGVAALPILLPDLKSRLSWGTNYAINTLHDQDKITFLTKRAAAHGLILERTAAEYLLKHCPRDIPSLISTFDRLDKASLAEKRRLTIPFIRNILHP